MRAFSTVDLVRNFKAVTHVATREPVTITQHRKPRFILMAIEDFEQLARLPNDPHGAYGPGETPPEIAELFRRDLDRIIADAAGEP